MAAQYTCIFCPITPKTQRKSLGRNSNMVLEEIDITRWLKQYLWESILQARKEWYLWNIRLYKYGNKKMLQKKLCIWEISSTSAV